MVVYADRGVEIQGRSVSGDDVCAGKARRDGAQTRNVVAVAVMGWCVCRRDEKWGSDGLAVG